MSDYANLEIQDNISFITLDDGKVNAFSIEMLEAINACLDEVPRDKGCLVIKGREGFFSAGFDLKTFASKDFDRITKMSDMGMQLMFNLFTFPRPTISVLTGHTIAMGLFMSTSTDYRIGLDDKFIVQANEVRNGMDIPTSIMELVASRITKDHAYRILLHADPYSFHDAVTAGIIDELVAASDIEKVVLDKAADLATLGHPQYEKTKSVYIADTVKVIEPLIFR